ncbi:keratin, type I cytoskeletal 23 [Ictidomys tridecemlineatus]|uniref:Keratin 23 n=1 Tax=Ictidomys tridecemlineatus TaxID=43179 RepID=I3MLP9_ICTTR|nr:keratin, type I cytoskeletal 23 [Ictidomys tridecemlineatus]KAG3269014.1 keratin 23 [Ictidomys tridecemlineatus]
MNSSRSFSQTPSAVLHGPRGARTRPGSFPRAPSVHGGAGGAHISLSFATPSCLPPGGSWGSGKGGSLLSGNGKETMQNLNDRLASYLDKVRALEEANMKLESRILQWHQQRDPDSQQDYSQYEENISHLQEQIVDGKMTNAQMVVLIDNARMAVDDFSLKYENEHSFKKDLEIEVEGLRKTLDDLTIVTTDLEQEVEGMRKELILMKKHHEQELRDHHVPNDFNVNVKVNTTPGEDLIKVLEDMRQEYELIIKKKHQDLDTWFKEQSTALSQETASPAAVQGSPSDIHELKRTFQALEIDLQTQHNRKSALENMLSETQSRYSCQLQDMQQIISHYEQELMQLRHDLERQNSEYKVLLGIKTHLEKEIATYRQLLDGESNGMMEESKSSMKASTAPKIKAITQESINGRIVLSQVNEIQKHE